VISPVVRAMTPSLSPPTRTMMVRSGFCQGVARDSVLSFGSSVSLRPPPVHGTAQSSARLPTEGNAMHLPPMVCGRFAKLTEFATLRHRQVERL
jgi:hypothetical protein